MALTKIDKIITVIREERYRWTPVRRTLIPKKSGKLRALGLPTWSDKLLQEVIRSILDAYYEPQFSQHSHGFRSGRGCHTALDEITRRWHGVKWYVEGDISRCFDSLDHQVMLSILNENLRDNRFLRLLSNLLKAGYLEDWKYHATLGGVPQGGVVSPALSNVYLDRLDQFVGCVLLPTYNYGEHRKPSPPYMALLNAARNNRIAGDHEEAKKLRQQAQRMPSRDPNDPEFRRLWYVRYADDWLLGFSGPRDEAEQIKVRMREFLQDELKLELSQEKTLITNARTEAARFLGYEIINQHADDKHCHKQRSINGASGLKVPVDRPPEVYNGLRSEIVQRLLADQCEICGSEDNCEVHHVRKLADLDQPGQKEKPLWAKRMAARRRKTLVVCQKRHEDIHRERSPRRKSTA